MNDSQHDLLLRRRDLVAIGEDHTIRRRLRHGQLVRVAPGIYAELERWRVLDPLARHRMLVLATAERLRTPVVFSHHAAAALFGIRLLGDWPRTVDVTLERATGGRSDGGIRRHCTGLDDVDIVVSGQVAVTSPAQTVVDLARMLPFADAVVAMDSALHRKRAGGALTTKDALLDRCAAIEGQRGWRRAHLAAEFSTHLSDSPEESHSRIQIHLAGFPRPELQQTFVDAEGFIADTDFYWRDCDHAGECDGRDKYRNPAYLRGRDPADVVIAEKNRENRLRRVVRTVSRWEPADLYPPSRMVDILIRAGLPRSRR
ncbi:type IV toxin-antitoxin system AbiEi family antitoxin domain-containing protein [Mycetocola sp.]|uniref:type IV toxin-antitoxin system AbiEi family antitoxin domain-containing protein n=1 Tax=Mycetocola sp. TaxID=1871042 RepID=UPI0039893233